jgi:membrane protein DedA with SNARE-associated domain
MRTPFIVVTIFVILIAMAIGAGISYAVTVYFTNKHRKGASELSQNPLVP